MTLHRLLPLMALILYLSLVAISLLRNPASRLNRIFAYFVSALADGGVRPLRSLLIAESRWLSRLHNRRSVNGMGVGPGVGAALSRLLCLLLCVFRRRPHSPWPCLQESGFGLSPQSHGPHPGRHSGGNFRRRCRCRKIRAGRDVPRRRA